MKVRQFATQYVNRWWIPPIMGLITLGILSLSLLAELMKLQVELISITLFCATGLSLLGMLASAAWNFTKKRWQAGVVQLLMLLVTGFIALVVIGGICFALHFAAPIKDASVDNSTTDML